MRITSLDKNLQDPVVRSLTAQPQALFSPEVPSRRRLANAAAEKGNLTKLAYIARRAPKTLGGPCHQPGGASNTTQRFFRLRSNQSAFPSVLGVHVMKGGHPTDCVAGPCGLPPVQLPEAGDAPQKGPRRGLGIGPFTFAATNAAPRFCKAHWVPLGVSSSCLGPCQCERTWGVLGFLGVLLGWSPSTSDFTAELS